MGAATLILGVASMGAASTAAAPSASAYGPAVVLKVTCKIIGNREVCTFSGSGFYPDVVITLTVHSSPTTIGTLTSSSTGTFGPYTVALPCGLAVGQHTLTAADVEGQSASLEMTVPQLSGCYTVLTSSGTIPATAAPVAATPGAAAAGSSSALAFTGADTTVTIAVAAALIAIGGMVVTSTRRRRRHDWPSARG
jgi:hypothetical protein